MKFLKSNYFSIIAIITIILINSIISKNIGLATEDKLNDLNFFVILKQSLTIPAVYLLMNIFSQKALKNKQLIILFIVIIAVESTFKYFKNKPIVEYNFLLGMLLGLVVAILLNSFQKKIKLNT